MQFLYFWLTLLGKRYTIIAKLCVLPNCMEQAEMEVILWLLQFGTLQ